MNAARAVLAYEGMTRGDQAAALEQAAGDEGIWQTGQQNERRWQAAKMATLSRLIGQFPSVRAATVIIEPSADRTLAHPGSRHGRR